METNAKIKPLNKQETLEEVAERLSKDAYKKHSVKDDTLSLDEQIQRSGGFIVGFKEGLKEGAKWQQDMADNWLTMKEGDITVNFKPMPEFDEPAYPTRLVQLKEQAWDVIYQEFIKNTDGISSLALLEYLKDNYNPPTKKQDNDK